MPQNGKFLFISSSKKISDYFFKVCIKPFNKFILQNIFKSDALQKHFYVILVLSRIFSAR